MAKPKTHIEDPTQDAPKGAAWTLCGLFGPRELVWTTQIRRARNASGTATPGGGLDFLVSPALLHRQR